MKHRQLRVNELVKRELSGIITREINFEGALVSINAVDVAPDLKSAHVFVSTLGADNGKRVIDKLEAHRPALQAELSRQRRIEIHAASHFSSRRVHQTRCARA